jgi:hypothetical protein
MKKIKINKLPEGFKLVDGKVVETKFMRDGGDTYTTGDQADYGLVTTPQNYYGSTNFNNTRDESVRFSLSGVPRDNANIEAEGGETVLTDLNDDGSFGLYDIKGPRHSKGGVPMYLPEQSFIFSDTPKLKFTKDEMAEFDVGGEKKTPAKISKKFGLNEFYGELDSQYADNISSTSAELMLKKNMEDLSKLAFVQEAKKDFSDGVPLASHPYLLSIGQDPIEFTAKMEEISVKKAEKNAFEALPPQQQQQMLMLQQMMAQAQQEQPNQESSQGTHQMPDGSMMSNADMPSQSGPQGEGANSNPFEQLELAEANNSIIGNSKFGGHIPKAEEGDEVKEDRKPGDFKNPYPAGSDEYNKLEEYKANGYELSIVDGQIRAYKPYESRFNTENTRTRKSGTDVEQEGGVSIYNEDIEGQGEVLQNAPIGEYRYGILSEGNRPLNQKNTGAAYGSADITNEESKADFMNRWGDVVENIDGFAYDAGPDHPQWAEFQILAEETRKNEAASLGIPYVPYFKKEGDEGYRRGEGFDGALGLHTFNTPRLDVDFTSQEENFMNLPIPEEPELIPNDIKVADTPDAKWWSQDLNNLSALGAIDDNLYMPWAPQLEDQKIDYVLDDYTGRVNANLGSQNTMAQALGAYGPQAIARSNIQGKTLAANAQAINQVNQNNVKTMNQVATLQPQLDMKVDMMNNATNTKLYDDTNVVLQNADNFANWKIGKNNELFNAGATNLANTANLNSTNDLYKINPEGYGLIDFTGKGNELYEDPRGNAMDFNEFYADLNKNNLSKKDLSPETAWEIYQLQNKMKPTTTSGQQSLINNPTQGYTSNTNITDKVEGKNGIETRKWAMPFYSGKMGA